MNIRQRRCFAISSYLAGREEPSPGACSGGRGARRSIESNGCQSTIVHATTHHSISYLFLGLGESYVYSLEVYTFSMIVNYLSNNTEGKQKRKLT